MKNRTIKVGYLARVEGEGALHVRIKDGEVVDARLDIFEPPRFFEGFLRGRNFTEAVDITARICGICPIAYQMSAAHAMEMACGVRVDGPLRELRRLIYCGEWIESHVLHVYMLHAPDFLGYQDAVEMARNHPDIVKRGLELKKLGNDIVSFLAGREIHPINVRVGGFYSVPTKTELEYFVGRLRWGIEAATETIQWVAGFPFPNFEHDYEFLALHHPKEYPLNEGRIVSNKGLDIDVSEFPDHIEEHQVKHSTSLHSRLTARGAYLVGPLARYNLNFDRLPSAVKEATRKAGLGETCANPFKSIIARSVETLFACHEALRIIDSYEQPHTPYIEVPPREGVGHGATEAPRGTLYHRYGIDDHGVIQDARIVAPTSQNQTTIENDLFRFVGDNLHLDHQEMTWKCEQVIRNYDPCISCSCHFLKVHFER